ncbi:hypothetical protein EW146_g5967 [Bondarzewia mesenterica]|uniref:RNase III domain-containing protein n=1 Tax=Bondarzewia mesenterica TaxID=1095465 RepID=A0A4S4LQY3_9AGAM|nr:hypothetical protein EW146_g5967 [Bondarzewia mesenterica]
MSASSVRTSNSPQPGFLKRLRPTMGFRLPPLPSLDGDLMLDVYTHKSIRYSGAPMNDEYGDIERVNAIGKRVLAVGVATALFEKKPMFTAAELEAHIDKTLSDSNIDAWVTAYQLREKVRAAPDHRKTLTEPKETRHLFHSVVGAVYVQFGLSVVQTWIGKLVDPDFESSEPSSRPNKRFKSSEYIPAPPPPPPPPPVEAPPPLPSLPMPPVQHQLPSMPPQANSAQTAAFLPVFNQTCAQRRITVSWEATSTGPSHAPAWNVQCIVNGISKGSGNGRSKQLAKEAAAREAFHNMGWARHI